MFILLYIVLLPYQFLQVSSQSDESCGVIENARDLFEAVARNKTEMVGKFVGVLRKNEEKLEKAYSTLKVALESSVSKHRYQPNSIQRNGTIKREAGNDGLPDYEAEFTKICGQMKNVRGKTKREEHLFRLLVNERAEKKAEQKRANDAEKDKDTLNEERFFVVVRQVIDDLEEDFPQPYDDDWEAKRVQYDKSQFKGLVKWDLHQERRRQKWKYYLENPPNKRMETIAALVSDKNTFADGIGLGYRLLSDKFHKPFLRVKDPANFFIYQRVVDSLRILLKHEGILEKFVDQLNVKIEVTISSTTTVKP